MRTSTMNIEYNKTFNTVEFHKLSIGDVFRKSDEDWLYMVINMPPDTLIPRQGVCLKNGGRRVFSDNAHVVQVKVTCSWVDMQP